LDVRGKIVLAFRYTPEGDDPRSKFEPYAPLRRKAMAAREKGAVGILLVTPPSQEEDLGAFRFDASSADSGLLGAVLRREFVEPMVQAAGKSLADLEPTIVHNGPQSFPMPGVTAKMEVHVVKERRTTPNVLGWLEGRDSALKNEVLVIGAHYDHLGLGGEGSRAEKEVGQIHNGADDNASGTAALIELAEYFGAPTPADAASPDRGGGGQPARAKRSLLFAAFSGEEIGLLGSSYYVKNPTIPLERVVAMLNMDMIGRSKNDVVTVIGTGTSPQWKELLSVANGPLGLTLKESDSGFGGSDQSTFYARDRPVLHFFTGVHPEYHTPQDDWELINAPGEEKIARLVAGVLENLGARAERIAFAKVKTEGPSMSGGFRVYLGTIPDYSEEVEGVKLTGVREGSPAAAAGLQGGDVIVEFAGRAIKNIYDYTYALQEARPGEPVTVGVLRDGERITVTVTPTKR
jgi:hypothetical protein